MARLGHEAATEAAIGAKGKPRIVELASRPVVTDGNWRKFV